MLRCYGRTHVVGISKTAYMPVTPRCLDWGRGLQPTSTTTDPTDSDSQEARRRPTTCRRHGDRQMPWLPVAGVLVITGWAPWCASPSAAQHGLAGAWPGRRPSRAV